MRDMLHKPPPPPLIQQESFHFMLALEINSLEVWSNYRLNIRARSLRRVGPISREHAGNVVQVIWSHVHNNDAIKDTTNVCVRGCDHEQNILVQLETNENFS